MSFMRSMIMSGGSRRASSIYNKPSKSSSESDNSVRDDSAKIVGFELKSTPSKIKNDSSINRSKSMFEMRETQSRNSDEDEINPFINVPDHIPHPLSNEVRKRNRNRPRPESSYSDQGVTISYSGYEPSTLAETINLSSSAGNPNFEETVQSLLEPLLDPVLEQSNPTEPPENFKESNDVSIDVPENNENDSNYWPIGYSIKFVFNDSSVDYI